MCIRDSNRVLRILQAAFREILFHPGEPGLEIGIVLKLRIRRVFDETGRHDALCLLDAGRLHHRADRRGRIVDELQRMPAYVICFADRLRGKLRRRDIEEYICATARELEDLRVDGGIGDFVARLLDCLLYTSRCV